MTSISLSNSTRTTALRILFAGTPEFAVATLARLIKADLAPIAVLTQPDRPAGRGRQLQSSPVKKTALEAGIEVFQPATLKQADVQETLREWHPDLMVVVAYGLILPPQVLSIPRLGCWNVHASLLPRWRGAAPIHRAIEAGDSESGVCIMQMDKGLDTGPVITRQRTSITSNETSGSLHERLAEMGAECLVESIVRLLEGETLRLEPQGVTGVSYAKKLSKSEAELDWQQEAIVLERKVRAFNPWPVAWCQLKSERTRIWSAKAIDAGFTASSRDVGDIAQASADGIDIVTSQGYLRLLQLQRPSRRRMTAAEYLDARNLGL